ncbi:6-carboxyhexanoate--CoA ligase [Terrisporobacter mayombei]|uniref:6-carboxyhexanoate--CoA ligase n=1 Tax=Terrisporobacter mayombei TaxID=1541 RepID=A0ABY9Q4H5_9FIRM|nr:6-carboxyhexanoate--CoA ligase [Terrisporobacter mayombei]MCC3868958.1 6-carboxyhexanoate--CoA ligase [Terrisporobacter mayombei]WMT82908.1 6-carboxyhexanoate--CoA ligase [Terrisporobacter mayombei]
MALHSIKMRSSKDNKHISGAENIIDEENLEIAVSQLIKRALTHSKGKAENINIKIEKLDEDKITYLEPLKVTTVEVENHIEGFECVKHLLNKLGIDDRKSDKVLKIFKEAPNMRGSILLDINTLERLEPDKERGIRVTYMDFENFNTNRLTKESGHNTHFIEALALATKVINCPCIIGEICYSDDPNYTAGYISSKKYGYVRFPHLKQLGDESGGRIFLYDSSLDNVKDCLEYIEKSKTIIRNNISQQGYMTYEESLNL